MRYLAITLVAIGCALGLLLPGAAKAETTKCTVITALPIVITKQGVYCFKGDVTTAITSGYAIEIRTNNVTIDLNGWKLGGLAAGTSTNTRGIYANDRSNITIRNGSIRGFRTAITFAKGGAGVPTGGHLIEGIKADSNRSTSIFAAGDNVVIRNNHIINTGNPSGGSQAIAMWIQRGNGFLISDNIINGVDATSNAFGILGEDIYVSKITGNRIFGLKNADTIQGIRIRIAEAIAITGNQLTNLTAGTTGIGTFEDMVSGIDCVGNIVRGFFTAIAACDYTADNYTP